MKNFYINQFKIALENGESDDVLNAIIEMASDHIEDNDEYNAFHETVIKLYKASF